MLEKLKSLFSTKEATETTQRDIKYEFMQFAPLRLGKPQILEDFLSRLTMSELLELSKFFSFQGLSDNDQQRALILNAEILSRISETSNTKWQKQYFEQLKEGKQKLEKMTNMLNELEALKTKLENVEKRIYNFLEGLK